MPNEDPVGQIVKKYPLLVRVVLILIILEGFLGFMFFTGILVYQLLNPDFLNNWNFGDFSGIGLLLVLFIFSTMHLGLIIGGIMAMNRNKKGLYIIFLSIVILILLSYFLQWKVNWIGVFAGVLVLLILSFYRKSFA